MDNDRITINIPRPDDFIIEQEIKAVGDVLVNVGHYFNQHTPASKEEIARKLDDVIESLAELDEYVQNI